jgi:hypothetical protein
MFARFATDASREEEGVWVDFGDGIEVKVRRLSSKISRDVRKRLEKPHAEAIRRGPLPESLAEDILNRQLAEAIISDWKGVDDDNGQPLACTVENKIAILKALPEFRDEIVSISIERDNYKAALNEDAEKNSSTS